MIELTALNRQECIRYLGGAGVEMNPQMEELLNICEKEILSSAHPKFLYKEVTLADSPFLLQGEDIQSHLKGCDKALLILNACRSKAELISSMGAALKVDASQVMVGEFWSSKGCPLARALRKKFKRDGTLPERKFRCVFSPEVQENRGKGARCGSESCPVAKRVAEENDGVCERDWCGQKEEANGSLVYITATFGMRIAGEIIKDCYEGRGGRRRDV